MLAVAQQVKDKLLGVVCPYHVPDPYSIKAVVSHYQTRKLIITSLPNIVVFPGKIGTFDELVSVIGWIKSSLTQKKSPPYLYAHNFWQEFCHAWDKKGVIQSQVKPYISFFEGIEEIIEKICSMV